MKKSQTEATERKIYLAHGFHPSRQERHGGWAAFMVVECMAESVLRTRKHGGRQEVSRISTPIDLPFVTYFLQLDHTLPSF